MTAARAADVEKERDGERYTNDTHIVGVRTERENTHTEVGCTPRFWSRVPPLGHAFSVPLHPHTHRVVPCIRGDARTNQHVDERRSMKRSGADDVTERYRASLLRYNMWGG